LIDLLEKEGIFVILQGEVAKFAQKYNAVIEELSKQMYARLLIYNR
jgi:hypothetical protein